MLMGEVGSASSDWCRAPSTHDLEDRLVDFAVEVCQLVRKLPADQLARHIGSQLLRSGTSAAANYAEARSGESRRDFVHKIKICLKELRESLVWLKLINRLRLVPSHPEDRVLREADELVAMFVTAVKTAERAK